MEMKRMIVFTVMMLTIGNLLVESEVINRRWGDCFKICYNVCISSAIRNVLSCFPKCEAQCGHQYEIDVSAQDPSKAEKEIGVKKTKDCVNSYSDICDKKD
ncbi:unnamed protein product [Eruca vesicaria subsp. sativa]|uniref:Plant thionin family protein n=1 Tax=Eruca vesicaria subsp. sativa TaxID=29727 RepID=A0ABC8KYS5_ERUVS|nr:unnamed protein product [Eruca vesicaria subsp. sativa]